MFVKFTQLKDDSVSKISDIDYNNYCFDQTVLWLTSNFWGASKIVDQMENFFVYWIASQNSHSN